MSWADHVNEHDLRQLGELRDKIAHLEGQMREQIDYLREMDVPWSMIANELCVSKQAAQQRYGKKNPKNYTPADDYQLTIGDAL